MNVFDRKNKFGRYCVEAIIPGWGSANIASGSVESGMIRGVGRRQVQYPIQQVGSPAAPSATIDTYPMMGQDQWGHQARWIENKAAGSSSGFYFADLVGDLGPISPACPAFTVIGIVKLIGNGSSSEQSDPRIWSKDVGASASDHDLMIGLVRHNGRVTPRTRIRIDTVTETVFLSGTTATDVVDDGWHLIAATVKDNGGGTSKVTVHGLYPDGRYTTNDADRTGSYNPRTTTTEGMWATVGSPQNITSAGILGIWFFEGAAFNEGMLREFWQNPWQVFKPRRLFVHTQDYFPSVTLEEQGPATINESISFGIDVDTTEFNVLTAAAAQTFTIDLSQAQTGDLGVTTLTITLVDSVGTPLQNLSGLSWAWFDESTVNSATIPPDAGTGATTDSAGVFSVELTNTTLTSGQTGMLALQDSTGYIYALYRITLD